MMTTGLPLFRMSIFGPTRKIWFYRSEATAAPAAICF